MSSTRFNFGAGLHVAKLLSLWGFGLYVFLPHMSIWYNLNSTFKLSMLLISFPLCIVTFCLLRITILHLIFLITYDQWLPLKTRTFNFSHVTHPNCWPRSQKSKTPDRAVHGRKDIQWGPRKRWKCPTRTGSKDGGWKETAGRETAAAGKGDHSQTSLIKPEVVCR